MSQHDFRVVDRRKSYFERAAADRARSEDWQERFDRGQLVKARARLSAKQWRELQVAPPLPSNVLTLKRKKTA